MGTLHLYSATIASLENSLRFLVAHFDVAPIMKLWPVMLAGIFSSSNAADKKPRALRILLVDDDKFMLDVMSRLLRRDPRYAVVAEAHDAKSCLTHCATHRADLIVLDINLPGRSGIEIVAELKSSCPASRILLCTADATDSRIVEALRSGAHGFVEKTGNWNDLIEAIERVAGGEHYLCARSTAALAFHSQQRTAPNAATYLSRLTMREREVLKLVASGKSSKDAATALGVSVGTINVHRANLMKKLGASNTATVVAFAFNAGLMS